MDSYSVLIVEDDTTTLEILIQVVESEPRLTLAGTAMNYSCAVDSLGCKPDIILIDIGLPDGNGIDLITHAKESLPDSEIMVISCFGDEKHVVAAIEAGATGYILKDNSLTTIGSHILSLIKGDSPISPGIARYLLRRFQQKDQPGSEERRITLTEREQSVLMLIAKGHTRVDAARLLDMSEHTASTHIKHIYRKLSVHSQAEAVFEAYQRGLIKLSD